MTAKEGPLDSDDFPIELSSSSSSSSSSNPRKRPYTFHIKTYGCQMNVSDSDIVRAVLLEGGYREATVPTDVTTTSLSSSMAASSADILLTNTCAIRESAEDKVWQRLRDLRKHKKPHQLVGILGCMAERLQYKLLEENMADLVVGPDQYRQLPQLLEQLTQQQRVDAAADAETLSSSDNIQQQRRYGRQRPKQKRPQAINVELSLEETYDDIIPVRDEATNPYSAFVSIQRGCSNRCSFCIVPFTRGGQERSRSYRSIIDEVRHLVEHEDLKEVVLLGQNVNSYHDRSPAALLERPDSVTSPLSNDGFRSRWRRPDMGGYRFVDLVEAVSDISPELRVRFTSPHPKDYPVELLHLMADRPNVCSQLHMPAQSGSTSMLRRMKRGYSREAYIELIDTVRAIIPDVALSSDFIAGFCDETDEEHADTVRLLEYVGYDQAFLFAYSMRDKTHASRTMDDNIPSEIKQQRLQELIDVFRQKVHEKNVRQEEGKLRLVLVEGPTRKQSRQMDPGVPTWHGRTDQNKRILFSVPGADERFSVGGATNDNRGLALDEAYVRQILHQQHWYQAAGGGGEVTSTVKMPRSVTRRTGVLDPSSNVMATTTTLSPGDYAVVLVTEAKGHTLRGRLLWKTTLANFAQFESNLVTTTTTAAPLDQVNLDLFQMYLLQQTNDWFGHKVGREDDSSPMAV